MLITRLFLLCIVVFHFDPYTKYFSTLPLKYIELLALWTLHLTRFKTQDPRPNAQIFRSPQLLPLPLSINTTTTTMKPNFSLMCLHYHLNLDSSLSTSTPNPNATYPFSFSLGLYHNLSIHLRPFNHSSLTPNHKHPHP